jgi:hypothetical protein
MEATVNPPPRGDHPENGVLIPCRFTAKWGLLGVTLIGIGVMLWARIDDRRKGLR